MRLIRQHLKTSVREAIDLRLDGADQGGVAMTGIEHRNAAGKVDVSLAFHVPDFGVFATVNEDLVAVAHAARYGGFAARKQGGVVRIRFALYGAPSGWDR